MNNIVRLHLWVKGRASHHCPPGWIAPDALEPAVWRGAGAGASMDS